MTNKNVDDFLGRILTTNTPPKKEIFNFIKKINGIPEEKLKNLYRKDANLKNILSDLNARH